MIESEAKEFTLIPTYGLQSGFEFHCTEIWA